MGRCGICAAPGEIQRVMDVPDFFLEKDYTITVCPSCGVKKTEPFPEDLSGLYKVQSYNKRQNSLFYFCKGVLIRREIRRIFRHTQNRFFLDVGSGGGEFSQQLYQAGHDAIAADSAPQRPVYLEKIAAVPYMNFDYGSYALSDRGAGKGRTVVLRHVLEHVTDPARFLGKFIEDDAAFFYIAVPNTDCLEQKVFRRYYSTWYVPYHLWHFNISSLRRLFERMGIEFVAGGYDTIPTVLMHVHFYMRDKKCPEVVRNLFAPTGGALVVTSPLNLVFPNNVVWVIGKNVKR
mgnify:FL=1